MVTKETSKPLNTAGTGSPSIVKATDKVSFDSTGTGASVASALVVILRSFSYSGTGTSVFSRIATRFRAFTYDGTGTAAIVKQTSKFLTMAGLGTAVRASVASRFRAFTFTGTGTLVASATLVVVRNLVYTGAGALGLTKRIDKALLNSTGSGAASLIKEIGKSFTYAGAGSSDIVKDTSKNVLDSTGTGTSAFAAGLVSFRSFAYSAVGTLVTTTLFIAGGGVTIVKSFIKGMLRLNQRF